MRRIVLHDYFKFMEGGGRLSLILGQNIGADLGYGFKKKNHPYFDIYPLDGKQFDLACFGYLPGLRNLSLIDAFRRKTRFVKQYDIAVYSGFYAPLAVIDHGAGRNFHYCHTPPRYIYDQRDFYLSRYPRWTRPLISLLASYHRRLYETALKKMDRVLTNSYNVQKRIKKYLDTDASVVYPPCEVDKFRWTGQKGFYLSAARLDPLKRVDVIIDAFKLMPDRRLVVVSDGPESNKIRRNACGNDNIEVLGHVSDLTYRRLMGECIASIYIPKDEDFGMTAIESMASGKPVIGVNEGGLTETIVPDETGILLEPEPKAADVAAAVRHLNERTAKEMRSACRLRAKKFDVGSFIDTVNQIIF